MLNSNETKNIESDVLRAVSGPSEDFRSNIIGYIKTYFADYLEPTDLKLLESDEGLRLLQARLRARMSKRRDS